MRGFEYLRVAGAAEAVATVSADPGTSYLAGGTTQIDLMKDGVLAPTRLVDITGLPLRGVTRASGSILIGALSTMEQVAADPSVTGVPMLRQALLAGASVQLRNAATIGGNLLQRTRCRYFRDPQVPCGKRVRGEACSALAGTHRMHAVLGTSEHCIATHASDLTVALAALNALVRVQGRDGARAVPITEFYREPGDTPDVEHVLAHGELITAVEVPVPPAGTRSTYLKVRDRASYEFALTSVAAALLVADGVIFDVRLALGGVATIPWRARTAKAALRGSPATPAAFQAAAEAAVHGAVPRRDNAFKVELAKRSVVRALLLCMRTPERAGAPR